MKNGSGAASGGGFQEGWKKCVSFSIGTMCIDGSDHEVTKGAKTATVVRKWVTF